MKTERIDDGDRRQEAWLGTGPNLGCLVQSKTPSCAWRLLTSFHSFPPPPAPLLFSPDKLLHLSASSFIAVCNWDISIVATGILRNLPVIESIDAPPLSRFNIVHSECIYECPNQLHFPCDCSPATTRLSYPQKRTCYSCTRPSSGPWYASLAFFHSSSFSLFYFGHQFHSFSMILSDNRKTVLCILNNSFDSERRWPHHLRMFTSRLIDHRIILQLVMKHHRRQTLRRSINR